MPKYLCISITFVDGMFHGTADGRESEWPPSPMRVFQALLAGSRTGCRNLEWSAPKIEAFRWLEASSPPIIVAPDARETAGYTFFVPDNVSDVITDREGRLITKVARPQRISPDEPLHYLWLLDNREETAQHASILIKEARKLLALGWGVDQVVGDGRILDDSEAAALRGKRWYPLHNHAGSARSWRVPERGSLDDLERVYQSFFHRLSGGVFHPPLKLSSFSAAIYLREGALPPRSYAAFELPDGISFRQEHIVKVAAMLRSLAARHARSDTHEFPGGSETYVAGHVGKRQMTPERFSYLPLPTIGHQHADGMVRRLLVAEPYGGDGGHAQWAQRRLAGSALTDSAGNERGVLLNLWRQNSRQMLARYVGEGRSWSSVTPVILPGFDDGKVVKAERLLLQSIRQAGLPVQAVMNITLRKAPLFPGSQHPSQYFLPGYLRGKPGWHAHLEFEETIPGPLSIGAGRHVGLGIFAHSED